MVVVVGRSNSMRQPVRVPGPVLVMVYWPV
jgi:hypothetical protein